MLFIFIDQFSVDIDFVRETRLQTSKAKYSSWFHCQYFDTHDYTKYEQTMFQNIITAASLND